ncbi:hypothetical protein Tco_1116640 [Tanacetum coccineum]
MITTNSRIEDKKLSGLMLPPQLKTKGMLETFPYVKDAPTEPCTVKCQTCNKGERTLHKSVSKSKQQCPWESIYAEGQECSPRSEHSHGYVPSKPTSG